MATFLLLLCIGAGCAVIGILFMLYGPTTTSVLRVRTASTGPTLGFSFAPPPPPPAPFPIADAPPPAPFAPFSIADAPPPAPFAPVAHSLSTDFSIEEPVREVRIRAKSPSPPPLPPVTPLPPPPIPPQARGGQLAPPSRAEATPASPPRLGVSAPSAGVSAPSAGVSAPSASVSAPSAGARLLEPPRLGVSAPSARGRHLEPPRRMPAPLPRSRAARGSDGPPLSSFATDQQRTAPRDLDDLATAEHTFVD